VSISARPAGPELLENTQAEPEVRSQPALKKAFPEITASERELRDILDSIRQTIVLLGPDGAVLYANRYVLEYTGFTLEEMVSGSFHRHFVHPDDVSQLQAERSQGLSRGLPFEVEYRVRRNDGQYRWSLIRYNPQCDEQGRILRWYATGTDMDERRRAEERMRNENLALREDIARASMFEEIVGSSAALQRVLAQAAKVAKTDSTVVILGETGTGKELLARAIHRMSSRSSRAFIRVNCAAIPPSLIASELFGHEKGAFTGALQRRLGRFEAADGGRRSPGPSSTISSRRKVPCWSATPNRRSRRSVGTMRRWAASPASAS
jgi:formate hydrogenlyase transcriptional activator